MFDWRLAEGLPRTRRLILSGGLHPDNVAEAITHLVRRGRRRRQWRRVRRRAGRTRPRSREFVRAASRPGRQPRRVRSADSDPTTGRRSPSGRSTLDDGGTEPDRTLRRVRWPLRAREPDRRMRGAGRGLRRGLGATGVPGELDYLLANYAGRPTPTTLCERLSQHLGVRVLLEREDLNHTGSHKLNNVLGQGLLAQTMGKRRLIAETGAGQHGVAPRRSAALLGMECVVYMGEVDIVRQELNVFRMNLLGAEVRSVSRGAGRSRTRSTRRSGTGWPRWRPRTTASDRWSDRTRSRTSCASSSVSSATRHASSAGHCSAVPTRTSWSPASAAARTRRGPSPGFAETDAALSVSRRPAVRRSTAGRRASCTACGPSSSRTRRARFSRPIRSLPGLTIPASGPEHARLAATGRAMYVKVADDEVLPAFQLLSEMEGIIPALEPAHAIAWVRALR